MGGDILPNFSIFITKNFRSSRFYFLTLRVLKLFSASEGDFRRNYSGGISEEGEKQGFGSFQKPEEEKIPSPKIFFSLLLEIR